jgi:hypothetical protein
VDSANAAGAPSGPSVAAKVVKKARKHTSAGTSPLSISIAASGPTRA